MRAPSPRPAPCRVAVHRTVALVALTGAGACASTARDAPPRPLDGPALYVERCVVCHLPDGRGTPGLYRPLTESALLRGDPTDAIRLLLHGMRGERRDGDRRIPILMMPSGNGTPLDDEAIARVLTHSRRAFGGMPDSVRAEQVAAVRAATAGQAGLYRPEELGVR